jgi:hypothetical protein
MGEETLPVSLKTVEYYANLSNNFAQENRGIQNAYHAIVYSLRLSSHMPMIHKLIHDSIGTARNVLDDEDSTEQQQEEVRAEIATYERFLTENPIEWIDVMQLQKLQKDQHGYLLVSHIRSVDDSPQ